MDANAIRNYERQTGQTYQPLDIALPPSDGTESIDPAPQTNSEVTLDAAASSPELSQPAALPTSTKTAPQTRTSWLPAWLRWTR
jgi:hypothetical protein